MFYAYATGHSDANHKKSERVVFLDENKPKK